MSFNREKLKEAILYISRHPSVRDLGLTKLYKLVFFSDAYHLRAHGQSITGSDYIKYEHGPVPSRAEKCIKALRRDSLIETETVPFAGYQMIAVRPIGDLPLSQLSEDEIATLDCVCRKLGSETAKALSERSHLEPAWIATKMLDKIEPQLIMYGVTEDPDGL